MQASSQSEAYQLYLSALAKLNPAQQRAVQTIEGPVMVLAGPGTGKTQILGLRVAHIVHLGSANPEEILCITFTNAGAREMRQRVGRFIGEQANLSVFTFHGFCQYLLQRYTDYFPNSHCHLWSDWERISFLRRFMREKVSPGHLLRKYYNIYRELPNLQYHWQLMDSNRDFFFPQDQPSYAEFLQKFMEDLPQNPEFQYKVTRKGKYAKGEPKIAEIQKKTAILHRTMAASKLYLLFKAEQKQQQFKSFQDLINEVLDFLLSNDESAREFLRELQERYQYILVDEFQDTNAEQYKILQLLCTHWQNNSNIFVVGDQNQSIYAFQGASAENLQNFCENFIGEYSERIIPLEYNYRSPQPILDLAYKLLNNPRNPILQAQKPLDNNSVISWHCYARTKEDYLLTGLKILQLSSQNIPWKDIAVLYPKHRIGDDIEKFLGPLGIPFNSRRADNILNNPLIQYWLQLLEYIIKFSPQEAKYQEQNAELLALLCSPLNNPKLQEIWLLWESYSQDISSTSNLLEYILSKASLNSAFPLAKGLQACLELANNLKRENLFGEGLLKFLQESIEILHLEQFLVVLKEQNPLFASPSLLLRQLQTFIEFTHSCIQESENFNIETLLERIAIYQQEELPIEPIIFAGEEEDAVSLLSLHSSKGLEYEHVFIIGNECSVWLSSNRVGYRIEPRQGRVPKVQSEEQEEAERQRLLYVGITRAKANLYIHYPRENSYIDVEKLLNPTEHLQSEPLSETDYVELLTKHKLQNLAVRPTMDYEKKQLDKPIWQIPIAFQNSELYAQFLANFELSYSAFELYLNCPLRFYAKYILKWPERQFDSVGLALGKFTHQLIHNLWQYAIENNVFPNYSQSLAILEALIDASYQSKEQSELSPDLLFTLKQRFPVLHTYLHQQSAEYSSSATLANCFKTEQQCQAKLTSSKLPFLVKLKGFLDLNVRNRIIVDYKTQQKLEFSENLENPLMRQVLFYQILLGQVASKVPEMFIFAHIKEEEVVEKKLELSKLASLGEEYAQLLLATYRKISMKIFSFSDNATVMEGCGECELCRLWQSGRFDLNLT